MKITHAVAAFTAGYLLTSDLQLGFYSVLFGLISDLDLVTGLKHRTVTHSLIFLITTSVLAGILSREIGIAAFIGIGVHIFLDMLTKSGVQLYWPLKKRVRVARFSYDGLLPNYAVIITCWILIIYFRGVKELSVIKEVLRFS